MIPFQIEFQRMSASLCTEAEMSREKQILADVIMIAHSVRKIKGAFEVRSRILQISNAPEKLWIRIQDPDAKLHGRNIAPRGECSIYPQALCSRCCSNYLRL